MPNESISFQLHKIDGKHGAKSIKNELDTFQGVTSVSVNVESNMVAVDYDSTGVGSQQLQKRLETLGYKVEDQLFESY